MPSYGVEAVLAFPASPDPSSMLLFEKGLGIAYISAFLAGQGHRVVLFASDIFLSASAFVRCLDAYRPRVVGFTVYQSNYLACKVLAEAVKRSCPGTVCIFGGPAPTAVAEAILLDAQHVDICVRGAGEEALLEILRILRSHEGSPRNELDRDAFEQVPGIHFRSEGRPVGTPDRELFQPGEARSQWLDRYPSPYLSGVLPPFAASSSGVITARGCNQNCTYCNCSVLWKRHIHPHSVDRVLEELSFIAQADFLPGLVNIVDDAFNLIPRRAERICKGLLENRIRLQMHCLARCDLVNEDLLRLMYEAGFVALGISLESAVPRVLRAIGKVSPPGTHSDPGLTRERGYIEAVARCVGLARKIGFHRVAVSIMVGLPGESVSEAQQTLEFVKALGVDFYYHSALRIYPGTPLFEEHARYGYGMDDLDGVLPFPGTSHPYPVESRVRPVAGLSLEDPRRRDSEAMGVLSLLPVRKEARGCFNNVVLFSENLTEDLVRWMKKNLALSGRLIHLYRNPESEPDPRDVEKFLHRWGSPTLDYRPLRVVDDAGGDLVQFCHETSRFFQVKLAVSTREDAGARVEGSPFFLALRDMDDVEIFCRFIEAQNRAPDTFQSLSGLNDVPLVERLCMWLGSAGANCHTFETALVDEDGKVRLCGQADPSGTLGDGFSALRRNFSRQKEESSRRRSCAACEVRARCIQCPFPAPLNESAYCVQRRLLGEESAAEALYVILRSRFARLLGPWRCTETVHSGEGPVRVHAGA